nr:hypothetical protein [Tanacetum cinerariifolium]
MIAVNNQRDSLSLPPLVAKPKKGKSQTVAPTLPKSQGPKASGALSKKRTKTKSKRPPTKTKESPPKPTEGSEQSYSDEAQESDEEVLAIGDDMNEDPQDDKEVITPFLNQDQPAPSHVSLEDVHGPLHRITKKQWEQHKEATVSYADLKALVDQYYDEKIAHKDQTDKLVEASISSLDRIKDDHATKQKINEATETFARISSHVTETALKREISSLRQDTSEIKSMMTEMDNETTTTTEEPPSHTEGETKERRLAIPISSIPSTKLGIHPKEAISTKAGELFKKDQDAELEVLKRQHIKKVRKSLELRKHKCDSYMWIVSRRLKPKPITDIKIHPKTKPVVITVYRDTDGRNFNVQKPFLFGAFGISELDEPREVISKKKNIMVKDLMNSLSQRYERLRQIPRELGIQPALLALEQALSQTLRRIQKHMKLEPETRIPGLECN